MVRNHLAALEAELIAARVPEAARGAVWSEHCREWVYFNVVLDLEALGASPSNPVCGCTRPSTPDPDWKAALSAPCATTR